MDEIVIFDLPKVSLNKWYAGCHWTKRQKLKEQYLWLVKRRISVYPITVSYFFEFKTRPLDASNCVAMIKLIEDCMFDNDSYNKIKIGAIESDKGSRDKVTIRIENIV